MNHGITVTPAHIGQGIVILIVVGVVVLMFWKVKHP